MLSVLLAGTIPDRILRILNLEDTPRTPCAFAIERWRGVIFASAVFFNTIPNPVNRMARLTAGACCTPKGGLSLAASKSSSCREFHHLRAE